MGRNKDIDTTAFRNAIWYYVHCIYGVRHDDYNYGVINDLLQKHVRSFIKLISCFPENTTRKDYRHFMTEFMQSEKVSNINRKTLILLHLARWPISSKCINHFAVFLEYNPASF